MNMVSKILEDATKLVERGWTQGAFTRDANGRSINRITPHAKLFCAHAAIAFACGKHPIGQNILDTVYDSVFEQIEILILGQEGMLDSGDDLETLEKWNDAPERKKEEVISLFRKAAESAHSVSAS